MRQRLAVVVEHVGGNAQARSLDLAAPHGLGRNAQHEAADDVGAARDRGQMHVALDVLVDIVETLLRKRRAGRHDRAQRREVVGAGRRELGLLQRIQIFRGCAEVRALLGLGIVPENASRRMKRRAIIEQQRGSTRQPRHQPVPHHPAQRGEVEQAVAGLDIRVQAVLAQMLE